MRDRLTDFYRKFKELRTFRLLPAVLAIITIPVSIWLPEVLGKYRERDVLDRIYTETVEEAGEGYRYRLNANEKLFLLSSCLNSRSLPESEQNALVRTEGQVNYQEPEGTYAFIVNHKGPTGREITDEQIYETCNRGIEVLKELDILPDTVKNIEKSAYDAYFYSAIDVLEPRNNVAVWKLSLSNSQKNANKENRLIDAYIDADNGKIYEFYVRTPLSWNQIDADKIVEEWSTYMGLTKPAAYETDNPLLETTPYFKKYVFEGGDNQRTVVTVGFYEGINELFLKISR